MGHLHVARVLGKSHWSVPVLFPLFSIDLFFIMKRIEVKTAHNTWHS